jgi:hypothetical protein
MFYNGYMLAYVCVMNETRTNQSDKPIILL